MQLDNCYFFDMVVLYDCLVKHIPVTHIEYFVVFVTLLDKIKLFS